MNQKAQVTVEFIIVLGALLSVLLFSLFVFGENQSSFILAKEQFNAKLAAGKIAMAINSAYLAGNGVKTEILLEKNMDYKVAFSGNAVNVQWNENFFGEALLTSNITSPALSSGTKISIENIQGAIIIDIV